MKELGYIVFGKRNGLEILSKGGFDYQSYFENTIYNFDAILQLKLEKIRVKRNQYLYGFSKFKYNEDIFLVITLYQHSYDKISRDGYIAFSIVFKNAYCSPTYISQIMDKLKNESEKYINDLVINNYFPSKIAEVSRIINSGKLDLIQFDIHSIPDKEMGENEYYLSLETSVKIESLISLCINKLSFNGYKKIYASPCQEIKGSIDRNRIIIKSFNEINSDEDFLTHKSVESDEVLSKSSIPEQDIVEIDQDLADSICPEIDCKKNGMSKLILAEMTKINYDNIRIESKLDNILNIINNIKKKCNETSANDSDLSNQHNPINSRETANSNYQESTENRFQFHVFKKFILVGLPVMLIVIFLFLDTFKLNDVKKSENTVQEFSSLIRDVDDYLDRSENSDKFKFSEEEYNIILNKLMVTKNSKIDFQSIELIKKYENKLLAQKKQFDLSQEIINYALDFVRDAQNSDSHSKKITHQDIDSLIIEIEKQTKIKKPVIDDLIQKLNGLKELYFQNGYNKKFYEMKTVKTKSETTVSQLLAKHIDEVNSEKDLIKMANDNNPKDVSDTGTIKGDATIVLYLRKAIVHGR